MFLDDEIKWDSQGRFAGRQINCGHFFALSKPSADKEATFYEMNKANASFLSVQLDLTDVLDLTSHDGLNRAFVRVVEHGSRFNPSFIAQELVEIPAGGSILTDKVGHWAKYEGYKAILFIGARAVHGTEKPNSDQRPPWDHDLFGLHLDFFLRDRDLNLVVFEGRYLTSRVEQHRVDDGPWVPNALFGMSEQDIETLLTADPEYGAVNEEFQRRKRRGWLGKIKYPGLTED